MEHRLVHFLEAVLDLRDEVYATHHSHIQEAVQGEQVAESYEQSYAEVDKSSVPSTFVLQLLAGVH